MSAIRHKVTTKARVVELYDAGWRPADIQRLLEREGRTVPSKNTIWTWTHPRKAARQAQRDLAKTRRWRLRRASFAWSGVRGPEWKTGRMRAMRAAGVSLRDIARVMALDFPDDPPLTVDQVRHRLSEPLHATREAA